MRYLNVFLCLFVGLCLVAAGSCLAEPTITIDAIESGETISGTVTGLGADYGEYMVVVYVRTDQWYIHPYAGQGEGKSWAKIDAQGRWKIRTVKREFMSNSVAALVVNKNYSPPSQTTSLDGIQARAEVVLRESGLRERSFYGKL
jgi:hypothetical protein